MCNLYPQPHSGDRKPISLTIEMPAEQYETCLEVAKVKRISVQQVIAQMAFQTASHYLACRREHRRSDNANPFTR